ncbi:hypothetical protein [Actinocorallia longicatena]|uniref:Uncharacterized protein n=1 Tax=Actinocorallia longicatena TaxID=111803 RepID=A0ABP6QE79_9ACTN
MNDFDTDLRAAVRALADTPVPPGYDPRAIRRAARRRSRLLAAASAAAVVTVAGTAVALTGGDGDPAPLPLAGPPTPAAKLPRFGDELIHYYLPATGPQYTDGYRYGAALDRQSGHMRDKCLADRGVTLPPDPRPAPSPADRADNTEMPDLGRIAKEGRFVGEGTPEPPALDARTRRARDACLKLVAAEFAPIDAIGRKLQSRWWQENIQVNPADPRVLELLPAFRQCALDRGVPGAAKIALTSSTRAFGDFIGPVDGLIMRAKPGEDTAPAVRVIAEAFAACARPVVDVLESLQTRRLTVFLRAHAREIAQLRTVTDETFTRAERKWGAP